MPRLSDDYDPNSTVSVSGAPQDYATTKASPDQMGAQVGQATERFGNTVGQAEDKQFEIGLQQQGLANEHEATAAELDLSVRGGDIYNKFNNLEGLDASNSKNQYVKQYTDLNNEIASKMSNPAARRAYETMATRRMSFTIQNMNAYAATQQKKAYRDGRAASMNQHINDASNYMVANNQQQFDNSLGGLIFDVNTLFTSPDYGKYQTVPAKTGDNGKLEFNTDTTDGKLAQADYDNFLEEATSKIYKTATMTLYNDHNNGSINKAIDFLDRNKSNMTSSTYASISHELSGPYRMAQTRSVADQTFSDVQSEYKASLGSSVKPDLSSVVTNIFPGSTVTSGIRSPEHNAKVGGVEGSFHRSDNPNGTAVDFVAPAGTTKEQVRDAFTHSGYEVVEVLDPEDARKAGEKDHFHVAVKVDPSRTGQLRNFSDYVNLNYDKILAKGDDASEQSHPGDVVFAQQARQQLTQRLNTAVMEQNRKNTVDSHNVYDYINKAGITNVSQLNSAPPEIRQSFEDLTSNNPQTLPALSRIITSKSFNRLSGYGPAFYQNFLKLASGEFKNESDIGTEENLREDLGKNSPLTNTGFEALASTLKRNQAPDGSLNPDGANFLKAQAAYLAERHQRYVGPKSGEYDVNPKFNDFLAQSIPQIEAAVTKGQKEGMSLSQIATKIFSPKINGKDNPDYIRSSITPDDPLSLMKHQTFTFGGNTQKYKTQDELEQAYASGKIDLDAAKKIASANKWGPRAKPSIPLPNDIGSGR